MRKAVALLLFFFGFIATSLAQVSYVAVSGTVTDANSNPYANAAYSITLVNPIGNPVSGATTPNGQIFNGKTIQGSLDATGHFSVQVVPNSILNGGPSCKGLSCTFWNISISAPARSTILTVQPSWTINYLVSISGDVDLSSALSSRAQPVNFVNLDTGQSTLTAGTAQTAVHAQNLPTDFSTQSAAAPQTGKFTGLSTTTLLDGALPVASFAAASGNQGTLTYGTDLPNPEDCGHGGSGDYGVWPCASNGTSWFSTGAMPTVGVPLVVRRSAFNSGLSALKTALTDEFHQYVNINLTASDSITWCMSATGTGTTNPRNHLLTDVRSTLTAGCWANRLRDYLGQTYFGGTAAVADFGTTITAQSPGTGYSGAWTMAFTGGTCSIQPTGTVTLTGGGLVFAMVNPGDCSVAPTAATFAGGTPGSGASVTVGSAGNGVGSYSRTVYIAVNDPAITWFGNSLVTNSGNLTGTAMDLTANTSYASFNFYGDSFTLIYDQLPGTGTYDLIVDGVDTGTFGVSGTTTFNVTRFHTLGTVGQHTVKILNTSAPDDKVRIGALQILRKMRLANNGLIGTKSAEWGHTGALLDGTLHSDDEFIFSAIGTNDATNTTTPPYAASQLKANYGSIVRYLQGLGLKVILIQQNNVGQTPACTEDPTSLTQPYCQLDAANALTTVANTYDVDLINQYPSTSAYNSWNIPCITAAPHPGDVCHTLMASNIENAIEQNSTPIGSSNGTFSGLNTFTNTVTFSSAAGATANTIFVDSTFPGASFQETFLSDVSGDATMFNNPITGNGSANATWTVFRQTNTSGQVRMNIYKGDGTPTVTSFISGKASSALGFGLCLGQTTCVPAFGLTVNGVTTGNAQLTLLDGGFTASSTQMVAVSDASNDIDYYINPIISGGTGHANINLFRQTSTSGNRKLQILKGDGTTTVMMAFNAFRGAIELSTTQSTVTGTTAGTAVWSQPMQGTSVKQALVYLNAYENTTGVAQTIILPVSFATVGYVVTQGGSCTGVTISGATVTLPSSMGATQTGLCKVEGY